MRRRGIGLKFKTRYKLAGIGAVETDCTKKQILANKLVILNACCNSSRPAFLRVVRNDDIRRLGGDKRRLQAHADAAGFAQIIAKAFIGDSAGFRPDIVSGMKLLTGVLRSHADIFQIHIIDPHLAIRAVR